MTTVKNNLENFKLMKVRVSFNYLVDLLVELDI